MDQKIVLTGLAALMLAASAAPASAQARRGSDIYISGDYGGGYGDYGYYGPGVGVSIGFGAPAWGYDDWGYGTHAAAPCTCGTSYRSVRVAPRYRASTYAWGGYPYDYDYGYASYPYDDYYYGSNYASVGFGWSDNDWRRRDFREGRRFDRFGREDRVRISNRETRFNDRDSRFNDRAIRGGREDFRDRRGMSRASVSGESRTTSRGGAEVRGGANTELRSGTNPADFTVRSGAETRGNGGATVRAGASGQTNGRAGRRSDNR
jgi:hypothetical protein